MTIGSISLSYPKPRELLSKIFPVARTDSSTAKCVLPKNAIIAGVYVIQTVAASTAAATFSVGWSGSTTAVLNGFSMGTTSVGYAASGTATGSGVATKLDSDKQIICTYTVGSSTAGGTGYVKIEYFVPGPGEAIDD
jgi:hypothetical protein